MKRFLIRLLWFIAPLAALIVLELFVLPIDFFSFRVWESLYVLQVRGLPPGRFYPGKTLTKVEPGDLAPYTPYALQKNVMWYTDRYGFRQEERGAENWSVVVVGDSGVVGTGLTQDDMVGQALERTIHRSVYSYAPFDMNKFVADRHFHDCPPDTVVLAVMERSVLLQPALLPPDANAFDPESRWKVSLKNSPCVQRALIVVDRFNKGAMLGYFRGRVRSHVLRWIGVSDIARPRIGNILFFEGESANRPVSVADEQKAVSTICGYRNYLSARGIRFVFVGVPNKENFYYDLFPATVKPTFLPSLLQSLRAAGVETVDLQRPFEVAKSRGETLYHTDDSHWNARGAELAAQEIAKVISFRQP